MCDEILIFSPFFPNAEKDWMCLNNLRILVYASLHRTFNFKVPFVPHFSCSLSLSYFDTLCCTCLPCKNKRYTLFPRFMAKKCSSKQIKVLLHHCFHNVFIQLDPMYPIEEWIGTVAISYCCQLNGIVHTVHYIADTFFSICTFVLLVLLLICHF